MADEVYGSGTVERVLAIDALRGFDMFWIIGGGDIVRELLNLIMNPMPEWLAFHFRHVEWEGFAAWDLIMPLFLFIVGTSLPYAMSKRLESRADRGEVYRRMAKRFVKLFLLGILVQGNLLKFDISQLHLFCNTLQAIAVGYVVAGVALMNTKIHWQFALCAALIVGYHLIMFFVAVPGHPAGMLSPEVNPAMYVDQLILGRFRDGTPYTWILSGMTFSATVLMGVMSGHILRSRLTQVRKLAALSAAGVFCVVAGMALNPWFPIVKHVWSSSFTLYSGGLCFLMLAAFYLVIDIIGFRKWTFFFVVIGANAIFVYTLTELVNPPLGVFLQGLFENGKVAVAAVIAVSFFIALWLGLFYMYRKRIFIKV